MTITRNKDNTIEIIQVNKINFGYIYNILLTGLILYIIGFWCSIAIQKSFIFIIISIPIWISGLDILLGTIVDLAEKQTIILTKTSLVLEKKLFGKIKQYEIQRKNIQDIKLDSYKVDFVTRFRNYKHVYLTYINRQWNIITPKIITDSEILTLFELVADEDKELLVNTLNKELERVDEIIK